MNKVNYTKPKNRVPIISFREYCLNRAIKKFNYTFRISNGEGYYLVNGEEMTIAELDAAFPTPSILSYSENCDKTKLYLAGIKSY